MKLTEGIEWAVHCCTLLASLPEGKAFPLSKLAEFYELPRPYLAKQMQALSRADLVEAVKGPGGGYRLARSGADISLLNVVEAIDGSGPAFRCTEIRQKGPSCIDQPGAYPKPCGIALAMHRAERAWKAELASVSIAELADEGMRSAPEAQVEKALSWISDQIGPI